MEQYIFPNPIIISASKAGNSSSHASPISKLPQHEIDVLKLNDVLKGRTVLPTSDHTDIVRNRSSSFGTEPSNNPGVLASSTLRHDLWAGAAVLLSGSLELSVGGRRLVNAQIEACGGVVVDPDDEDADADILIITHSDNREFLTVSQSA